MVIMIKAPDRKSKYMYTKAGNTSEYVESTYQGSTIIMKYELNEYKQQIRNIEVEWVRKLGRIWQSV
jgi:hypothetical protein